METIAYDLPPCPRGRLLLVNVGSDDRPASQEDIDQVVLQIAEAKKIMDETGRATIVTHHALKMTVLDI